MRNYLDLLQTILDTGTRQSNRTGVDTLFVPGAHLHFDLAEGFPIVTTKLLNWRVCRAEMIGHLEGCHDAAAFRALGCGIWDKNANENPAWLANPNRRGEDDLGRIYGVQWRNWRGVNWKGQHVRSIDQVAEALDKIKNDPTNRRIIIAAWNPGELDEMALPPCHVLYQFLVNVQMRELSLCMYQRSCDMFLGVPFNISGAALLLSIFAHECGLRPRHFNHFLADAHIYVNHREQVLQQLTRTPLSLPRLRVDFETGTLLYGIKPDALALDGYDHHEAIRAEMAV